jgi:hypothetical protein
MPAVKTIIGFLTLGLALAGCAGETKPTMQTSTERAAAKPPDENAAVDIIKQVIEAQATHFKVNRRYALSFEELVAAHLLTSEPTTAQTGYEFKLRPAADAQTYKLAVTPAASSSARSFFTDNTGVIHAETGKEATAESPALAK